MSIFDIYRQYTGIDLFAVASEYKKKTGENKKPEVPVAFMDTFHK